MEVGRVGDTQFRVTVKPAGDEFAARYPNADGGKPTPTVPADRELPLLRAGESAHLDLFEIPGMGLKLTDSIQVRLNTAGSGGPATGAMAFTALRVFLESEPRFLIPGSSVSCGTLCDVLYPRARRLFLFDGSRDEFTLSWLREPSMAATCNLMWRAIHSIAPPQPRS